FSPDLDEDYASRLSHRTYAGMRSANHLRKRELSVRRRDSSTAQGDISFAGSSSEETNSRQSIHRKSATSEASGVGSESQVATSTGQISFSTTLSFSARYRKFGRMTVRSFAIRPSSFFKRRAAACSVVSCIIR